MPRMNLTDPPIMCQFTPKLRDAIDEMQRKSGWTKSQLLRIGTMFLYETFFQNEFTEVKNCAK